MTELQALVLCTPAIEVQGQTLKKATSSHSKKGGKDQESIQSSTTPDPIRRKCFTRIRCSPLDLLEVC